MSKNSRLQILKELVEKGLITKKEYEEQVNITNYVQ